MIIGQKNSFSNHCGLSRSLKTSTLPDALSPQTLQATKLFVLDDELEFESAADVIVPVAVDVGENGWFSIKKDIKNCEKFASQWNQSIEF